MAARIMLVTGNKQLRCTGTVIYNKTKQNPHPVIDIISTYVVICSGPFKYTLLTIAVRHRVSMLAEVLSEYSICYTIIAGVDGPTGQSYTL